MTKTYTVWQGQNNTTHNTPENYFTSPAATAEVAREYKQATSEQDRDALVHEVVEDAKWDSDMDLDENEVAEFLQGWR